ncbi:hypothetical protein, partial [Desulfurispira natronophila]
YPLVAELATASGAVAIAGEAGMIRAASSSDMNRLLTPAGKTIISPLTTMIQSEIMQNPHRNPSHIATELRVHLGLADDKDLFGDVSADPELKNVAAVINRTAAAVRTSIESTTGITTTGFETAILALVTNIVMENLDKVKEELAKTEPGAPELTVTTDSEEIAAIGGTVTDSSNAQNNGIKQIADQDLLLWSVDISGGGDLYATAAGFFSSDCPTGMDYCVQFNFDGGRSSMFSGDEDHPEYNSSNTSFNPESGDGRFSRVEVDANGYFTVFAPFGVFFIEDVSESNLSGERAVRSLVMASTLRSKLREAQEDCDNKNSDEDEASCEANLEKLRSALEKTVVFADGDKRYTTSVRFMPHLNHLSQSDKSTLLAGMRSVITDGNGISCSPGASWDSLVGQKVLRMGPNEDSWWTLGKSGDRYTLSRSGNTTNVEVVTVDGAASDESFIHFRFDDDANIIMLKSNSESCGIASNMLGYNEPWDMYHFMLLNKSAMDKVVNAVRPD